jgi:ribosomal protein S18 acetylase RimI-like enzyme
MPRSWTDRVSRWAGSLLSSPTRGNRRLPSFTAPLYDDSEFQIRPLAEADLPALEWDGEYTKFRCMFRQTFDEMKMGVRLPLVLVKKTGREIIGQVFLQWSSGDPRLADGTRRGYLYALRVKPDYQGRGLGTRLIRTAEMALLHGGMRIASIGVGKDNPRAKALYERLGYKIIAEDPGRWTYLDPDGRLQEVEEPAWLMEKILI